MRLLILMTTLLMTGCAVTVDRGLPVATLHERRAEKMFEAGRIAEAMALFQQAAQATPRPFLASIGIARCAIRLGERELVATAFRVAYGSAPTTPVDGPHNPRSAISTNIHVFRTKCDFILCT